MVMRACAITITILTFMISFAACNAEEPLLPKLNLHKTDIPSKRWSPFVGDNYQMGYRDPDGKIVLRPVLKKAFPFRHSRAIVETQSGYYIIDDRGHWVTTTPYAYMLQFSEGIAVFGKKEKNGSDLRYGYLDRNGKVIYPARLPEIANPFRGGYGLAWTGEKDIFISKSGKVVARFSNANVFSEKLAAVQEDRSVPVWKIVDTDFQTKFTLRAQEVLFFSEGLLPFEKNNKVGYINERGETVITPKYQVGFTFTCGVAPVKSQKGWFFINKDGERVTKHVRDKDLLSGLDTGLRNQLGYIAETDKEICNLIERKLKKWGGATKRQRTRTSQT